MEVGQTMVKGVFHVMAAFLLGLDEASKEGLGGVLSLVKETAAGLLALIPPGRYGTPLQTQLARLVRQVSVTFSLFQRKPGDPSKRQVLLRMRGSHETYPGLYAVQANAMFVFETEMKTIRRMLQVLGLVKFEAVELKTARYTVYEPDLGWEHSVHFVEAEGELQLQAGDGLEWFDTDALPDNIVPHHRNGTLMVTLRFLEAQDRVLALQAEIDRILKPMK